jgi:hypothetical protein
MEIKINPKSVLPGELITISEGDHHGEQHV